MFCLCFNLGRRLKLGKHVFFAPRTLRAACFQGCGDDGAGERRVGPGSDVSSRGAATLQGLDRWRAAKNTNEQNGITKTA